VCPRYGAEGLTGVPPLWVATSVTPAIPAAAAAPIIIHLVLIFFPGVGGGAGVGGAGAWGAALEGFSVDNSGPFGETLKD